MSPGAPGALLLSLQQQEGGGDLLLHLQEGGGDLLLHLPPPALPGQRGVTPAGSLPPVPHVRAAGERGAERRGGEVQAQARRGLLEVPGRLPTVEVRVVWGDDGVPGEDISGGIISGVDISENDLASSWRHCFALKRLS